ncbi:REP-associated tyrosine transposase [Metabacillus bambusae]|uniref:Transposase n=1 Tax=Metabacillus bambusae TaxID=2795218 RepID=A0ABS3N1D5_9BACI|nr:transposase [Metabacillus bambusae]MBO1511914.1 transposase [Metabacillus bambusae]
MARQNRICFPGAAYHITARGNNKNTIFHDERDYYMYLEYVKETNSRYPFLLHSYCLMPNHLHLQIETPQESISKIMKLIQMRYAMYFNKRYSLVGHVFQERFGSKLILNASYFMTVNRYIHLNPVKANIVKKPEDYKWSSYTTYITPNKNPLVTTSKTLSYFSNSNIKLYKEYIEETKEEIEL